MKQKMKTHSGAKKRFQPKSSGKIKRKQKGMRHLLSKHPSKVKRHLRQTAYVHPSNEREIRRLLVL